MDEMAVITRKVGATRKNFRVIDTIGTRKSRQEWLNETHPNKEGFRTLATLI